MSKEIITPYQLEVAKKLIHVALKNAASSFSKMINETVSIKEKNVKLIENTEIYHLLDEEADDSEFYILTTEVKGKIIGKSYLLFNIHDSKQIFDIFTPSQGQPDPQHLNEFQKAILLELDNIIAASVISEISNILDLFTYGDVPHFNIFKKREALKYFYAEIQNFDVILNINAKFENPKANITSSFIWFFKSDFIEAIKNIAESESHMAILNSKQL